MASANKHAIEGIDLSERNAVRLTFSAREFSLVLALKRMYRHTFNRLLGVCLRVKAYFPLKCFTSVFVICFVLQKLYNIKSRVGLNIYCFFSAEAGTIATKAVSYSPGNGSKGVQNESQTTATPDIAKYSGGVFFLSRAQSSTSSVQRLERGSTALRAHSL